MICLGPLDFAVVVDLVAADVVSPQVVISLAPLVVSVVDDLVDDDVVG